MITNLSDDPKFEIISENLKVIRNDITETSISTGRNPEDVRLMAVTKTVDVKYINHAIENCGVDLIGENKVQELMDKYDKLPKDIKWHMIGHLQRNKVKYIVGKTYLIHSVDSLRLAEEISKEAVKKNVDVDILIEVNVAMEESKFGTTLEEAVKLTEEIAQLPNIHIKGYMTIAPFVDNPEENRVYFQKLKQV